MRTLLLTAMIVSVCGPALLAEQPADGASNREQREDRPRRRAARPFNRPERTRPMTLPDAGDRFYEDYAGNANPRQRVAVVLPEEHDPDDGPLPVVAFVHGGAWRAGDYESALRQAAPLLRGGDYAVASIGYRLTDEAIWPAQLHDVKAGLRHLRANADRFGIDPDRIAIVGPSAGGHLVAMLGTTMDDPDQAGNLGGHADASTAVTCVIDLYGPANLATMREQDSRLDHASADSPEGRLVGGAIADQVDTVRSASPETFVGGGDDAPFLIIHGSADPVVPYAQSVNFHAALKAAGTDSTLVTVEGGGHGGFANPEVNRIMRQFLDHHLLGRDLPEGFGDRTIPQAEE